MGSRRRGRDTIKPWLSARLDCKEGRFVQVGNSLLLSKKFQALTAGARFLYLCMTMESAGKREFIFPKSAAEKYGIARNSLTRQVAELQDKGFISVQSIDMLFRRLILGMALDIEHFEKVKLLNAMKNKNDDGYSILRSYFVSLETGGPANDKERSKLFGEIENNRSSIYCRDMLSHIPAGQEYPVWVFLEVITFGRFLSFLKFCADYFDDDSLRDDYYMMKKVKSLRNAAGHSHGRQE